VTIAAPRVPVVTSATVDGSVGAAMPHTVAVSAPDPVTRTMAGAPSGMTIGMSPSMMGMTNTGYSASPRDGSHRLQVAVLDSAGCSVPSTVPVTIRQRGGLGSRTRPSRSRPAARRAGLSGRAQRVSRAWPASRAVRASRTSRVSGTSSTSRTSQASQASQASTTPRPPVRPTPRRADR